MEPIPLVEIWRRLPSATSRCRRYGVGDSSEVSREDVVDASRD